MKRFLIFSSLIIFFLALFLVGGAFAMSEGTVFRPSSALYPLQRFTEHRRVALAADPLDKAHYLLRLAERRAYDLEALAGDQAETIALTELHTALEDTVLAVGKSPVQSQPELKLRLAELVKKIESILPLLRVAPAESPAEFTRLQALVQALSGMVITASSDQTQPVVNQSQSPDEDFVPTLEPTQTIEPQAVEFPDQSQAAAHTFFELTGKHTLLACETCHVDGKYAGTPRLCILCHLENRPENHYEFDCVTCHTPEAWDQVVFDHALAQATDCQSCHLDNRPLSHYNGQCSACHLTAGWLPASFDHAIAGATDCQSCHSTRRPTNHYNGPCSACHNTSGWLPAHFNHKAAGATDCQSCHNSNRPSNHYKGQCSACHNSSGWLPASFNHKAAGATDCQSCHSGNRPSNHFSGQCSSCHKTTGWLPATFNHSGNADCQNCHKPPSDHWSGNCSKCHSTSGWGKINVQGHSFPMDHGNADGQCSDCHSSNSSSANCYKCHEQAKMEEKHSEEGIFDIAGNCLSCHPNGEKKDD